MSRAGHQTKQLRAGEDEIDDLRDEEEKQSLAEMAKYTDNCERHPAKVAECVSNECICRVPIAFRVSANLFRSCLANRTDQLCLRRPKQTPINGSMKYRLNKCRSASSGLPRASPKPMMYGSWLAEASQKKGERMLTLKRM